jgi:hypothetical protein
MLPASASGGNARLPGTRRAHRPWISKPALVPVMGNIYLYIPAGLCGDC